MKRMFFVCLLASVVMVGSAQELYVGSYNIRYQNSSDSLHGDVWQKRCQVMCDQLNFEHPDVFGAQEVLHGQLVDMLARLDNYGAIGVGREDGHEKGEYAAVFYQRDRLELLDSGHFWLNETPDKPVLGWDAACVRICTWGRFALRGARPKDAFVVSGERTRREKEFFFFNLHMDHVGVTARREAAKLVVRKIKEIAQGAPVILTGDFNVDQNDEIYRIFTTSGLLKDSYEHARLRFAENGTFQSFKPERKTDSRIDHIMVSPSFSVERYGIRTDGYWTDRRRNPSDHYPVFVRLKK